MCLPNNKHLALRLLTLLLFLLLTLPCLAQDKNGVSPNTISLPEGPGSIEGLGKSFQPMLNTGSATYAVAIALPAGVNGHTPKLSLRYDSGRGYGPVGIGWTFGPGSVSRQTEKGIPRYVDGPNGLDDDHDGELDEADEADRFIGLEGEELVRLADDTYRARIEGMFIRYRRVGNHWEGHLKNGMKLEFGLTPSARVTDPSGAKIYRWLLENSTDTNGNVIEYIYTGFPSSDNQKYLKEIRYGPGAGPWEVFYFAALTYEDRPDWQKDYRSGFLIKTAKRLVQIDVGVQGILPDQCAQGDWNGDGAQDALVRRYRLSYEGSVSHWSYLSRVTQYGSDGVNYLPPISFSYATFDPQTTVSAEGALIGSTGEPVTVMDSELVELIDLNRDGLPDLLKTDRYGRRHTCYLNLGVQDQENGRAVQWDSGKDLATEDGRALGLYLSENQVHLADMNGDGISDLVHNTDTGEVYYYLNQGSISWGKRTAMRIPGIGPPAPFANDAIKTSDLDFDKRIDVVKSSAQGYSIWFNLGNETYTREVRTAGALHGGQTLLFSDRGVHLADMNGDRMNDVAKITPTRVIYCANMGHGYFDASVAVAIPDWTLTDTQAAKAQLQDINADGLADLVVERAGGNQLWYWLNLGTDTFSEKYTVTHMPTNYGINTVTRWADINGNGTTDLIYADSAAIPRLRGLDVGELVGGSAHPNMLTSIDNGLGVITQITYRSTTEYYLEAKQKGNPWSSTLPFPVSVVARVETTPSLDLDSIPGKDVYLKEYIYRDGYYDDLEKAFRGFAKVTVIEPGDASAPTKVTAHQFFTGGPDGLDNDKDGVADEVSPEGFREDEPLKGIMRELSVSSEEGLLYNREENDWLVKTLLTNPEGIEVRFAYNQETRTLIYEGTETPETLKITFAYDNFGNVIEEKNHGVLSITGDEGFTYTTYIHNTNQWILNQYASQYQTDRNGQKVMETRRYYDGDAYLGLALGMVEKGNLSREEGWVAGDKYVNVVKNRFDTYGNIIGTKDGNGNLREIIYDPAFHSFPVRETIYVGGTIEKLTIDAAYNLGLGMMTQSTDFNGHSRYYHYDLFGRLVKVIKPGDSSTYPTQRFVYAIADPHNGFIYSYNEQGKLTITSGVSTPTSVTTRASEYFGTRETFDTIQYVDGLGRKLALVEEAEEGFVFREASLFNAQGTIRYTFLPYSVSSSAYSAPSLSHPNVETHYDATGREIRRINPPDQNGNITQVSTQYLPMKRIVTDENNNTRTFISDGLERIIEVHEQNQSETYITRYAYDPLGNLTKLTDAQNNSQTMRYDGLNRKTEENNPDRGRMRYEYDDAGNLIKTIDNKGQVILYTYDGANRMVTEDYLDEAGIPPDITYHYDAASTEYPHAANVKGVLSWVQDLSGAQFFSYDKRGNIVWTVKRIHDGVSFRHYTTVMAYDAMDRVISMTYPDGDSVHYQYNNRNLFESIPGIVDAIDYHPSGQIAAFFHGNKVQTLYSYDPRHRLIQLETRNMAKGNEVLQHLRYTLDGVSNITAITDGRAMPQNSPKNATQSFQYDDLYRLTWAEGPGYGVINFQYDKISNMTWKKSPDPKHIDDPLINLGSMQYGGTSGSSNRSGRLPGDPPGPHAITSTESGFVYNYDDNGNMISHAHEDSYSWDFKDRLIRVQKENIVTRYVYDYTGQRVIKKVNDSAEEKTTVYVSEGYEIREGKAVKYVFAEDRRVARIEGKIPPSDGLSEQTLVFSPGWNFFSLGVEPEDPAIEVVFASLKGDFIGVWTFEASDHKYKRYVPGEGPSDLTEIHAQQGYLIHVTSQTSMVVTGTKATDDIALATGWNLIGSPADTSLPIEEAFASLTEKLISVWSYDNFSGTWKQFNTTLPAVFNDLKTLEPGKAYWVKINADGQLAYVKTPTEQVFFYHQDHLGSSAFVTDMEGVVVESTEFYPFGRRRYEERNHFDSAYKYTGKELDKESGLIYYGARYYEPVVGRFISVDPIQDGLNWYAYANNNPLKFEDPNGLWVESAWDALSLATGIASLASSIKKGDVVGAVIDSVGIVADTAALILPGVPGGASVAIKAMKGARLAGEAAAVVGGGREVYQGVKEGDVVQAGIGIVTAGGLSRVSALKASKNALKGLSKDKPVVVVGESMGRVNKVADQLKKMGYDVKIYNPRNFRSFTPEHPGVHRLDMEANRSWLRYWTQKKNANVVDIGLDKARTLPRSPFYQMENRSLYTNWEYENVIQYNPGF